MTCDRYWREGIVLVERGLDDPHRADCADCASAHASRQELIEALPLIGAGRTGDPRWQAQVWRRIDRERGPGWARWRWQIAGVLAAACVVVLWLGRAGTAPDGRPTFETFQDGVAMRGSSMVAGVRLRVRVNASSEVWLYRGDRLVVRCPTQTAACSRDGSGMTVEMILATAGRYHAFAVESPAAPPSGDLDQDSAALEAAGASYVVRHLRVR
jgi:hypothetical protein